MKTLRPLIALIFLFSFSMSSGAAISCLQNKETGLFEASGNHSRMNACDIQNLQLAIAMEPTRRKVPDLGPGPDLPKIVRAALDDKVSVSDLKSDPPAPAAVDITPITAIGSPTVTAAVSDAPIVPLCSWRLERNKSYKSQLLGWVQCAGWKDLDWSGDDMAPRFSAEFHGSFMDALTGLQQSTGWPIVVHQDNMVIRIKPTK